MDISPGFSCHRQAQMQRRTCLRPLSLGSLYTVWFLTPCHLMKELEVKSQSMVFPLKKN